ncbi:MAG TPA: hypothetical protein VJQ85_09000 [Gaiellaceae bacterium]|nr:hypothetical protein [Gaiellaceae bacterium]
MRPLWVTLAVGGAIGIGALVVGFAVQALALPAPSAGDRAAADAISVLRQYHRVQSTLRLGSTLRASCVEGWSPRRATLLRLSNGTRVLDYHRARLTNLAIVELELAGCPRVLDSRLRKLMASGAHVHISTDAHVVAVRFQTARLPLTLYLGRHGHRPLGVAIGAYRSRLRLG